MASLNGGHSRVHGPADVEYLHQPIEMLQYVDALGETKRIDSQQRGDGRIGAKHPYVFAAAEDVLVLSLCGLDHEEPDVLLDGLV